MSERKALIVVDLNIDFFPGGALAVPGGDGVLGPINALVSHPEYAFVVATQDWHPENHCSFRQWPPHCIAGTPGANLHPLFNQTPVDAIVRKGTAPEVDSFSGFYDDNGGSNGLTEWLRAHGINAVDIVGLPTDVCVRATALDAVRLGYPTRVILEGCGGVDPDATAAAIVAMREGGVEVVH